MIIISSFLLCRGLLIDIPCVELSFNSWNRSYLLLSKQTALFDPIDVIMSISKNEDDELFFCDFIGDTDVTRPTTLLLKHKK